jgi:hypothetical protein
MRPATWIFLRSDGRTWQAIGSPQSGAAHSNLRTEITAALSEGSTLQEIADAALLAVETIEKFSATEAAA